MCERTISSLKYKKNHYYIKCILKISTFLEDCPNIIEEDIDKNYIL